MQTKKHTIVQQVGCSLFYMTFYQLFDFVQHPKNKRSVSPHYNFKLVNTFDLDFFPLRPVSMHVMFTFHERDFRGSVDRIRAVAQVMGPFGEPFES